MFKRTLFSAFFALLLLMNVGDILAQNSSEWESDGATTEEKSKDHSSAALKKRHHIVTWNIPALALGKLSGGYEFMFQRNKSIKLAGGIMLPFFNLDNLESSESTYRFVGEFAVSGIDISPEIRFYMGKNAAYGRGFYIAPYMRLASYGTDGDFLRINEISNVITDKGILDISLRQFGFGLMLGTQMVSSGGFVFNFFFGFGRAGSTIDYTVSVDGWELADYEEAEQDLIDELDQIEADGDFGVLDSSLDPDDFETYAKSNEAGF